METDVHCKHAPYSWTKDNPKKVRNQFLKAHTCIDIITKMINWIHTIKSKYTKNTKKNMLKRTVLIESFLLFIHFV